MRRVFESVVNGVSICDARVDDFPLIYVNPAFEKMTGYESRELLGRNCRFLQRGKTLAGELAGIRRALQQGRDIRVVLENSTKEGATFWNELYLSPVFDHLNQLTYYVGIQNDITVRVELKRRMEHMLLHDNLTGLANRALAIDHLQQSIARAKREGQMAAVLFIDMDGFKEINDRYGHQTGDELLKAIAERLKMTLRGGDCAARLGGDEFVLIGSDIRQERAANEFRTRVIAEIEEPLVLNGERITPRASVGLSIYPRDGESPQGLFQAADLSMYMHKRLRTEQRVMQGDQRISSL